MTPTIAAHLARLRASRDPHPDDVRALTDEVIRLSRAVGPTFTLWDGFSEPTQGTLWEIVSAWDGWTNSDLQALRGLEVGERVQLSQDGCWAERVE